ncbi:MAG: 30S ribosome-binding factor RbfA [Lachnospiraceae bacterium]|nr:30S ribosome-binding factor RbfA [Lachnospiraceae bacterium]
MRKNSVKNTRINVEVQRKLSTLIREECKDPRIHPMTSVVAAEVAPDLKTAKIYISVLGDEEEVANTLRGLKSAASHLRSELAKSLNLRNTPELTFVGDRSIAYGVSMSKLIDDVTAQMQKRDSENATEE